jgi:hypothetical protein
MPSDYHSQLQAARDEAHREAERILLNARNAGRDTLSELEQRRFDSARSTMLALDEDYRRGVIPPHLQALTGKKTTVSTHVNEPELYRRGGPHSFGLDLIRASIPGMDINGEARSRLSRHTEEVSQSVASTEYRDLSRVDGSGGYA